MTVSNEPVNLREAARAWISETILNHLHPDLGGADRIRQVAASITRNINLKVGLLRVYIAVQVCWIIGSGILYLLNWPGDWKHDPDSQPWIIRAENVTACQDRVRSYQSEHDLNNLARRIHNALPEAPNFGRDERGLQITTLRVSAII